jgi:hypothetical protein
MEPGPGVSVVILPSSEDPQASGAVAATAAGDEAADASAASAADAAAAGAAAAATDGGTSAGEAVAGAVLQPGDGTAWAAGPPAATNGGSTTRTPLTVTVTVFGVVKMSSHRPRCQIVTPILSQNTLLGSTAESGRSKILMLTPLTTKPSS